MGYNTIINMVIDSKTVKEGKYMDILFWLLIIVSIIIAFAGLIYPVIPSVVFLVLAYILYGLFYSFEPLNFTFWAVQLLFMLLIFAADHLANIFGVKKYGGTKAGMWGSTIGLILGPFLIPFLGIIIGPFIGAFLAEILVNRASFREALKIGFGSVIGFVGSTIVKLMIMVIMVGYFLILVL
jgi:hypothetical protein